MEKEYGKLLGKITVIVGVIVVYYFIQYLTVVLAIYPHFNFAKEIIFHGSWVQKIDHHFWQMVITIFFIGIISKGNFSSWGFNLNNTKESMRILKLFIKYFGLYFVGVGFIIQLFFMPAPTLDHKMTALNIFGNLVFMGFISGLSEEIVFRGMIHTFLSRYFHGVWKWRKIDIPVAGVITSIIFTIAHINYKLFPFEITHLYAPQLVLAFVLGLYYSVSFHRTGSLLNPILAHNFSNGILYLSNVILISLK